MFTPKRNVTLRDKERIDQLTRDFGIIQSSDTFRFSMDAVLLARFCRPPHKGRIMDLCTGNGVIPIIMATRTRLPIDGVDIQPQLIDMARRSIYMNALEEQITVFEGDLRKLPQSWNGQYQLVTCNPPYLPVSESDQNMNRHIAIARHELYCTLDDVVRVASAMVQTGGRVAIVHRAARFIDVATTMRRYRLEPKRIRWVYPRRDREANMVLVEATKDGGVELHVEQPLIVYKDNGEYTDEIYRIYEGESS